MTTSITDKLTIAMNAAENAISHLNVFLTHAYAEASKVLEVSATAADGGIQATANLVVSTEDAIKALTPAPAPQPLATPPAAVVDPAK
jgi:hypothetical protein